MASSASRSLAQLWRARAGGGVLARRFSSSLSAGGSSAVPIRSNSTAAAVVAHDEHASTAAPPAVVMKGVRMAGRPLYLDMQATSPVDPRVLDAMLPHFIDQ